MQTSQGLYCSLRQLLEEGFFHADPHPGNLVATKSGSLAYFDFGMMGDIPRHYRVGLIQMVRVCKNVLILHLVFVILHIVTTVTHNVARPEFF
jgi:predicted unusual protein kinase regulating ubiquinone biosynthesis (AarF/ABC1/UbiB family)